MEVFLGHYEYHYHYIIFEIIDVDRRKEDGGLGIFGVIGLGLGKYVYVRCEIYACCGRWLVDGVGWRRACLVYYE